MIGKQARAGRAITVPRVGAAHVLRAAAAPGRRGHGRGRGRGVLRADRTTEAWRGDARGGEAPRRVEAATQAAGPMASPVCRGGGDECGHPRIHASPHAG